MEIGVAMTQYNPSFRGLINFRRQDVYRRANYQLDLIASAKIGALEPALSESEKKRFELEHKVSDCIVAQRSDGIDPALVVTLADERL